MSKLRCGQCETDEKLGILQQCLNPSCSNFNTCQHADVNWVKGVSIACGMCVQCGKTFSAVHLLNE